MKYVSNQDLVGRDSHFIAFKGTSHQETIGVLNIYALALAHSFINTDICKDIDERVHDFSMQLSPIVRSPAPCF